jgi:hypothetical protein
MSNKVIVYLGQKMTGLYCDQLLSTAVEAKALLEQAGFEVLSPVIEEEVPNKHIKLVNTLGRLKGYWKRDKECLQLCHLMVDYMSLNKSDGVNVEMGLTRFAYWKPLIRIYPGLGCVISKLEYDNVFNSLEAAIPFMVDNFGTRRKLLVWRLKMLRHSLIKFVALQVYFLWRCL